MKEEIKRMIDNIDDDRFIEIIYRLILKKIST